MYRELLALPSHSAFVRRCCAAQQWDRSVRSAAVDAAQHGRTVLAMRITKGKDVKSNPPTLATGVE